MVILALLPILFLIVALGFLKMAGWKACPIAAIIAFIVAVAVYDMPVPMLFRRHWKGLPCMLADFVGHRYGTVCL